MSTHNFETFPEKMFRHFGKTKFPAGSLSFEFLRKIYSINSVDENGLVYGDNGFDLSQHDDIQFVVTSVNRKRRLASNTRCTIVIERVKDR